MWNSKWIWINQNRAIQAQLLVMRFKILTVHYNDVIMSAMVSQITSLTIVCSTVYSGADPTKHQSSASLAFVRGIHRWPVNSPHKGPVTRKMFPFEKVIMCLVRQHLNSTPPSAANMHQWIGSALVQIMAWRWIGNKPLSEPMMVNLLMQICVTRPQWVKEHNIYLYKIKNLLHQGEIFQWSFSNPHPWSLEVQNTFTNMDLL